MGQASALCELGGDHEPNHFTARRRPIDAKHLAYFAAAPSSVAWEQLESRIEALARDWACGEPRPLVAYLPPGDSVLRNAALTELVKVDLELQWTAGRRPSLSDYCSWYPDLGSESELPADLVYEAWARRRG